MSNCPLEIDRLFYNDEWRDVHNKKCNKDEWVNYYYDANNDWFFEVRIAPFAQTYNVVIKSAMPPVSKSEYRGISSVQKLENQNVKTIEAKLLRDYDNVDKCFDACLDGARQRLATKW